MDPIRIAFFGTHTFGASILKALHENEYTDVTLVVTQPDRAVGRKQELQPPPVKLCAQQLGLTVDQPESLKRISLEQDFDLFVVAQYGLLIPEHVLEYPKHGTINVHTSLLPKYRGASPIQQAILNGDKTTGVTIMRMDEGLDTGPILIQKEINIDPDETYLELDAKLAKEAEILLKLSISGIISGEIKPTPQDSTKATTCSKISKEDGHINWSDSTQNIYNRFRAFTPWPGIWTTINGKRLKLLSIRPSELVCPSGKMVMENGTLYIGTHDASILVSELQLEGKKPMDAASFINGYGTFNSTILGSVD